jgi:hypothetical protein
MAALGSATAAGSNLRSPLDTNAPLLREHSTWGSRASPSVRPLSNGQPQMLPAGVGNADARALCMRNALHRISERRIGRLFYIWRQRCAERASAEAHRKLVSFKQLMEARSKRICVRYGRDKVYALLQLRRHANLQVAFERWHSMAVVDHAKGVLSRSKLQVQVALDQARAERGVYERAEIQASRAKRDVMLWYAFLRWRDLSKLRHATISIELLDQRMSGTADRVESLVKALVPSTHGASGFLQSVSAALEPLGP